MDYKRASGFRSSPWKLTFPRAQPPAIARHLGFEAPIVFAKFPLEIALLAQHDAVMQHVARRMGRAARDPSTMQDRRARDGFAPLNPSYALAAERVPNPAFASVWRPHGGSLCDQPESISRWRGKAINRAAPGRAMPRGRYVRCGVRCSLPPHAVARYFRRRAPSPGTSAPRLSADCFRPQVTAPRPAPDPMRNSFRRLRDSPR
jgi:hypothetical protein